MLNSIGNNDLAQIAAGASKRVLSAIQSASAKTGVNFAYMVQQAAAESSFNPAAKAPTSSASGLYQFIESTWLGMMKKYGPEHGINPDQPRKELLKLRNDPETASVMAAEFARENQDFLESRWGGDVGPTELYFAHFMGAGGASAFLKAKDKNPMQKAAVLFPDAARANRNIFYDTRTGRAKTLDEVYAHFDKKFSVDDGSAIASAAPQPEKEILQSVVFADGTKETIIWNDPLPVETKSRVFAKRDEEERTYGYKPRHHSRSYSGLPRYSLVSNPLSIALLSQMDLPK